MSDATTWVFETAILPGHDDAFYAVVKELIEKTRLEAGALGYEWYLSEDKTTCHVVERYRDSAAALDHLKTLGARGLLQKPFKPATLPDAVRALLA